MNYKYTGKRAEVEYSIDYGINKGYHDSLVELHPEITWKSVWSGDNQGDVFSIGFNKEGEFFYKNNSYGSCSGCDWVEGIDSEEEAIKFLKHQEAICSIGKDLKKVRLYLEKEVKNCYDFNEDTLKEFKEALDEYEHKRST